jgi:hypothetical protein
LGLDTELFVKRRALTYRTVEQIGIVVATPRQPVDLDGPV